MKITGPHTYAEAKELCSRYSAELKNSAFSPRSLPVDAIGLVTISPFDHAEFESFVNHYSPSINVPMEEIFYQEYRTDRCDVVVFLDTQQSEDYVYVRLSRLLQDNQSFLLPEDEF